MDRLDLPSRSAPDYGLAERLTIELAAQAGYVCTEINLENPRTAYFLARAFRTIDWFKAQGWKPPKATDPRGPGRQDYATPPEFMAAVKERFGRINCDLAAHEGNAQSECFLGEKENALSFLWPLVPLRECSFNWLNPPFRNIRPWIEKCVAEIRAIGDWQEIQCQRILMLVPASVGSSWFQELVLPNARVVYLLRPRLTFVGTTAPYPKDLMLIEFSSHTLVDECCDQPAIIEPWDWKA